MATSESRELCDICNGKHKTSMAVKWCPECEEKLCEDCHISHSLSKILRHHTLIEIADYKNIPDSILKIENFCGQHDMKYTNLCPQHDKLCCPACISGAGPHSECKTLLLQDVIKTTKTSNLLTSMKDSLGSLMKNIDSIIKDRQFNIGQLQEQQKNIEREIKQIKETILKQLDAIEKQIIEDLNSRVMQNTRQLESEIADLEIRLRKSEDMLKSTKILVDFGSYLQTYIGSKTIETEVAMENNSLQDLLNSGSLQRYKIELDKTKIDDSLLKTSDLFGTVKEDVMSVTFALTSDVEKQAQIITLPSTVSIDDVNVVLKSKLNLSSDITVFGCSLIDSGRVLIANHKHSCVVILAENGKIEKKIPFSSNPYDVTVIDNNTMAVSTTANVKIINITTGKTEKTIFTGRCQGVEYYNGSLICCVPGKGIVSVDVTSSNMTTLVLDTEYDSWLHCTVHRDNIYVSRYTNLTITCYSLKGEKLWVYEDTSVIYHPFSIAVDNSSNVYVASSSNNRVVVLTPDGRRSRLLLIENDGLICPTALHFDRSNNQLLVVNQNGPGYLFSL